MAVLFAKGYEPKTPLNYARIGWQQVITSASATGSAPTRPAAGALTEQTYEAWQPGTEGDALTLEFDATTIDYIGILTQSPGVLIEIRQDGEWREVETLPLNESLISDFAGDEYRLYTRFPDNEATMILLPPTPAVDGIRLTPESDQTLVKYVSAGRVLEMFRPFYGGHAPAMLNAETTREPNISEGGEWLGMSLIRQGRSTSMDWSHLPAPWYRRHFEPFARHAQTRPFFVAWNAKRFDGDCLYASAESDTQPSNMGIRDLMQVSVPVRAYSDGSAPNPEGTMRKVDFDKLWDFSRGSEATFFGVDGVLRTADIDEPRIQHDPATGERLGLLVEEQRTNLLLWSEDFTQSEWVVSGGAKDALSGAVAGRDAGRFTEDQSTDRHAIYQTITTTDAGDVYTISATILPENLSGRFIVVYMGSTLFGVSRGGITIDPSDGSITNTFETGSISSVSGDVEIKDRVIRVAVTLTTDNPVTVPLIVFGTSTSSGASAAGNHTGDDSVSFVVGIPQVEQASTPSSYIKTEDSQVDRVDDDVDRELGAEFNAKEWTVFMRLRKRANTGRNIATLFDPSEGSGQRIDLRGFNQIRIIQGGGVFSSATAPTPDNGLVKFAASLNSKAIAVSANGQSSSTSVSDSFTIPYSVLRVARDWSNRLIEAGTEVLDLRIIPRALSDQELQELTEL